VKREVSVVDKYMVLLLSAIYLFFALTYISHMSRFNNSEQPSYIVFTSGAVSTSNDQANNSLHFHRLFKSVLTESNKTPSFVKKSYSPVSITVFPVFFSLGADRKRIDCFVTTLPDLKRPFLLLRVLRI
jgi:hypothetical protein